MAFGTRHKAALMLAAISAVVAGQTNAQAPSAPPSPPAAQTIPAIQGVLDAFKIKPLVAISDVHGLAQELDFYAALLRDPRFAREVGNVVVEFGGASHQATVDRYVAGESVPYAELRKVWTDTVGFVPVISQQGFMNVFAQVRATNLALPKEQRIRVWLGEPPADWPQIKTASQLAPLLAQRETFPAELIRREILSKSKKALVIYGGLHFVRERDFIQPGTIPKQGAEAAVRRFMTDLAAERPSLDALSPPMAQALRAVLPRTKAELTGHGDLKSIAYQGVTPTGLDVFDLTYERRRVRLTVQTDAEGKIGAGYQTAAPGGHLSLIDELEASTPETMFVVAPYTGYADRSCSQRFEAALAGQPAPLLVAVAEAQKLSPQGCVGGAASPGAQAVLYLAPAGDLTISPTHPDIYLDEDYRREVSRRNEIMTGRPLPPPQVQNYPAVPRRLRP